MNVVASIAYEKRRQIGQGQGMNSEVFVAFDPQLSGEIVVKEVDKQKFIGLPVDGRLSSLRSDPAGRSAG